MRVVLKKRDARNDFREIWTLRVDPADMFVDPSLPASPGTLLELQKNGPPADKVDFLIVGDGYIATERPKFEKDARRLMAILFSTEPFKSRRGDFNVWALQPESLASGISRPSTGIHHRSRVGATYDAFGSERYVLTFDNASFRDVASFAPYDFVEILTNTRTYGGGGIFGLYGTVATDSLWSPYVFVHEFGHHFAGLADEYYTSDVAYEPAADRLEPWEPNVTALLDPAKLKWKERVEAGTPLPTPWQKEASRSTPPKSAPSGGRSAPRTGRRTRWTRSSCASAPRRRKCSAPSLTPAKWALSRAPCTRRAATSGRKPTASCSPATKSVSAASARRRSRG